MNFKCTCLNSGTNSFTGHCDRCGMAKPSNGTIVTFDTTLPPQTLQELFLSSGDFRYKALELLGKINELPRYTCHVDCQCDCMEEDFEGKYIKLEDVLNLFGAKKANKEE